MAVSLYEQIQDRVCLGKVVLIFNHRPSSLDHLCFHHLNERLHGSSTSASTLKLLLDRIQEQRLNISDLILTFTTISSVIQFFSFQHQKLCELSSKYIKIYSKMCQLWSLYFKTLERIISSSTNHFPNGWKEFIFYTLFKNQNPRFVG